MSLSHAPSHREPHVRPVCNLTRAALGSTGRTCQPSFAAAILLGFVVCFSPSGAQIAVGATGGTLGAGIEVSAGNPRLQARVAFATWSISEEITTSDVRYSGDLELENLPLLVDFFPTGGTFRLTAGVVLNDNQVVATAPLSQLLDPEDIPAGIPPSLIDSLGSLDGTATFDSAAPYFGIGFGNPLGENRRWHLKFDLGVLFSGEPDVDLRARLNLPVQIPAELQQIVDALVAAEEAELQREVDDYDLYPVVQLAISYRF